MIFIALGFLCLLFLSIKAFVLLWGLFLYRFGRGIGLGVKWTSDKGEFVIVTGAASALGGEYAREFASMNFNLILVDKEDEEMNTLAGILKEKYKTKEIKVIACDLTREDSYGKIDAGLKDAYVAVLVNAAQVTTPPSLFTSQIGSGINRDIVIVNCLAPVRMCEIVVPKMIANNRGVIINVSSQYGDFQFPFFPVYSPSKCPFGSPSVSIQTFRCFPPQARPS